MNKIGYKFMALTLRLLMDIHRFTRMQTPMAGNPCPIIAEAETCAKQCEALGS